ncbi:hypothetical protein EXE25_18850 [Acinetobacter bouvetii]|uniref:Uncharacterized protein n=1 Tax=Acinetobacter bouvetii TaxID=202951 RepID=A0A4Q7AL51_9GAMM|nr:hypothetical protein EXE25_18850 [Acinetobacter bouvetii]
MVLAVNKVSEKLTWLKNELSQAISNVENAIKGTNQKIDKTNDHLTDLNNKTDSTNSKLEDIKTALAESNATLKDIANKENLGTGSGGGNNTSGPCKTTEVPASEGAASESTVSGCDYADVINAINKNHKDLKDSLSTEGIESSNKTIFADSKMPDFNFRTDYFGNRSAQCPAPIPLSLPFGTVSISFDYLCRVAVYVYPLFLFAGAFFGYREFNEWMRA